MKNIHTLTWGTFEILRGKSLKEFTRYDRAGFVCRILGGYPADVGGAKPRREEVFRGPVDGWLDALHKLPSGNYRVQVLKVSARAGGPQVRTGGLVKYSMEVVTIKNGEL